MGIVKGCELPEDLYYHVDGNVWARLREDGSLDIGMTAYACSLAGQIVSFTPRKIGKTVRQDKSCGTVESGKWVGPVKAPVSGDIVAINEDVVADPALINRDPYGAGWVVRMQPSSWETDRDSLLTGDAALAAFAARMEADGFGGC